VAKDTVEGNLFIDVRYLHREGKLEPGLHFLSWTRGGGEPAGSITLRAEQDTITLMYSISRYGRDPEQIEQTISLTWTPAHFGGRRPWFICGNCGGRVAILYGAGKYFACRKCYDLTYRSCQESDKRLSALLRNPAALDNAIDGGNTLLALKALYRWEHRQDRRKKRGGR
jgi:hypothetical protein